MKEFDPVNDVEDSRLILDNGDWPNFHDAEVHNLNVWRGDVRPDDNVWIGPMITASFELCALKNPFVAVLRFHGCESITLEDFNHQNAIYDLKFGLESRGLNNLGEPLPPWILVDFEQAFGAALSFRCMRVQVLERRELE